jgi:hypothetical protein
VQFVQLPAAIVCDGAAADVVVVALEVGPVVDVLVGMAAAGGGETQYAAPSTRLVQSLSSIIRQSVSKVDEQVGANVKSSGLSAKNCWLLSPNLLATGPQLSLFAIVYHALHP